ncbi:uncharacterized protein BJX67DRAFT_141681 [Aspergillus lucknowensis]|uniref:Uncharacterized protein n=1 Tax=Aspergillus lucknowensis TaxID=176173 RepID=A0ABR4LNV2_9EURO
MAIPGTHRAAVDDYSRPVTIENFPEKYVEMVEIPFSKDLEFGVRSPLPRLNGRRRSFTRFLPPGSRKVRCVIESALPHNRNKFQERHHNRTCCINQS